MRIIRIKTNKIGGHSCMTVPNLTQLPVGWAVLPDNIETPNFPYGNITVKTRCGVPTVIGWTPKRIPKREPVPDPEPTADELMDTLLGVTEYE